MYEPGVNASRSTAPDHTDLKVRYKGNVEAKIRKTFLLSGVSPGDKFLCYNNTITGMERALKERLFYIPSGDGWLDRPIHMPNHVLKTLQPFLEKMKSRAVYTHPWTREKYSMSYSGQKQRRYLKATERLYTHGVLRNDANLKFFMKFESFNFTKKQNPSPRGINPPDDKYLVELGRYIKPIEKLIYKAMKKLFGFEVVLKGHNQESRGRIISDYWKEFADPIGIAADASKFEQSVSGECIEFEKRVYNLYYRDKTLKKLMNWQKTYIGKGRTTDGWLSFKISDVRASGMPNTALGNCLISCAMAYCLFEQLGIKYRFVCDGDDVHFIMERRDKDKFLELARGYYDKLGFRMKMEKFVDVLEHVDFCQSRPVFDGKKYIMVRNVRAALSKDSLSRKPLDNHKIFKMWLAAVGLGGIAMNGGIPIMQAYYELLLRSSDGSRPLVGDPTQSAYDYRGMGMNRVVSAIAAETRYSFWLAFNITPDEQRAIEQYYDCFELRFGERPDLLNRYPLLPM